ncbi:MAG: lysophospholipid acyltransferase family protein [Gemmatimonadetes bacterium]|nr:lysophospholipid acyltransferase family protein [Gemmatimonadota bacterium]
MRVLQGIARGLPRGLALRVFAGIAALVHRLDHAAVRRSLEHLRIAGFRPTDDPAREEIVRAMFRASGRNAVDLLRMSGFTPEELRALVRFDGLEHLREALARGRGVVALSAHFGNWEMLAAGLAANGIPVTIVARKIFDERSNRVLNSWRRACGVRVVTRQKGLFPAVSALRQGDMVGTLVDQDTGGPSIFADFFGRSAKTPRAPFLLARRTGAAMIPMWIRLDEDGVHRATIRPPLEPARAATLEQGLRADVERWHRILEEAIREHPEQWVWHHRRWKTRPPEESDSLRDLSKTSPYPADFQRSREVVGAR